VKTELILLAAGQSERFGGIKQLADISGNPMIIHCLSQFRENRSWLEGIVDGHVALGANANWIIKQLPNYVQKHVVTSWENGMGDTLSESMRFLANNTTHVLIGLGDQIFISQQMIKGMLDESNQHPQNIIAAKYAGRLGAPAIFPKHFFSELYQLTGDRGANMIMRRHSHQVVSKEMPEAAFDIDTIDDLKTYSDKLRAISIN
jgi:molybdenum cofactor cytidylyltransferase